MSIIIDQKKALMTMMGKRRSSGELGSAPMKAEIVKDGDGEIDGRHVAAQDAIHAISEKSPEKLMQALSNFMDIHSMKADESAPEDVEAESDED